MLELDGILVDSGGVLLGFSRSSVRAIVPWCKPNRLPLASPWLDGLLEGDGEAVPAIKESYWGGAGSKAEVYLMVEEQGRLLAVPGSKPTLVTGSLEAAAPTCEGEYWSATLDSEAGPARCVEVAKLYRLLGLLYNESRSDRGH